MKPENLVKRVFENWPAKVLSLAAALLLMLFFNLTRLEERTLSIPLAVSLNDNMVPSSQYPRMVRVVLKGEREVIYGIRDDEISASVDLSGIRAEGVYRVPVRLEKRGNALTADPLEIHPEPAELALGLERKTTKLVPVTPAFKGFLESGYELTSFDLNPLEVVISGPAGLVAQTIEIPTDTIELSGKKTDFSMTVRLIKKETLLNFEGQDSVLFSAKVRHALDVRTLENVTIAIKNLSPSLKVSTPGSKATVKIHLPAEALENFSADSLLSVDAAEIFRPGTYTLPVSLDTPSGSIVETYEPQSLAITVVASGE